MEAGNKKLREFIRKYSIAVVIPLLVGSIITYIDIKYVFYIFTVSVVAIYFLANKIRWRTGYTGFLPPFDTTSSLTEGEKIIGVASVSLMASPFIYMLGVALIVLVTL